MFGSSRVTFFDGFTMTSGCAVTCPMRISAIDRRLVMQSLGGLPGVAVASSQESDGSEGEDGNGDGLHGVMCRGEQG